MFSLDDFEVETFCSPRLFGRPQLFMFGRKTEMYKTEMEIAQDSVDHRIWLKTVI